MKIYAIVGHIASGKGEVAQRIAEKEGAQYLKLSDVLREGLTKRGIEVNRDTLTEFGNNLRKNAGAQIIAEITFWRAIHSRYEKVIIDGIRNPAEINFLRGEADTVVIAVKTSDETRRERYLSRSKDRSEDLALIEAFDKQNEIELSTDEFGQNLPQCIQMADYGINNEGDLDDLDREVEKALDFVRGFKTVEGSATLIEESAEGDNNEDYFIDEGDEFSSAEGGNLLPPTAEAGNGSSKERR
jgi:dephospho-CoA kinase